MVETVVTTNVTFLLVDMVAMMEAQTVMGATTNATFLPVDRVVMIEAVMETMATIDANSRVLK